MFWRDGVLWHSLRKVVESSQSVILWPYPMGIRGRQCWGSILKLFNHTRKKTHALHLPPCNISCPHPSLATANLHTVTTFLPVLHISCKWARIICDLFLTVFSICKVPLCWTVHQYFMFFISFCYWNNFISYYYFAIMWIYLILYVHSSFAGNLNCSIFWLLWIMLLWSFMCRFLCEHMFSLFLGIHVREESLGRTVTLSKWWILDCFPQWLHHFTFPPAMLSGGLQFLHFLIHIHINYLVLFSYCPPSVCSVRFSSVQLLSRVQVLWPHGPQHARPPCPSPTPRVYSDLCPLSWWCHPAISSSVIPFSSCLLCVMVSYCDAGLSFSHDKWY